MRVKGALVTVMAVLALATATVASDLHEGLPALLLVAQEPAQSQTPGPASERPRKPALGSMSAYEGLIVHDIVFRGLPANAQDHLRQVLSQKSGKPLDRDVIRQSIQTLYASGRFADIQVAAERTSDNQVDLAFITTPNYFVGDISIEGAPARPTFNQIVNASKFQLGELFTPEKMERALKSIRQLMQENGYYRSNVTEDEVTHPETQQVDLVFRVTPGAQAHVGQVTDRQSGLLSRPGPGHHQDAPRRPHFR